MPGWPRASRTERRRPLLGGCLAISFALAVAWPVGRASADKRDSARAVIVAKNLETPIARRLRAELTAQGFEVTPFWAPPTPPTATEVAAIEKSADAIAVLRLDEAARVVDVWLSPAQGATPVLVDAVRWTGAGQGDGGFAAVQAAEMLHAALRVQAIRAVPPAAPVDSLFATPLLPAPVSGATAALEPLLPVRSRPEPERAPEVLAANVTFAPQEPERALAPASTEQERSAETRAEKPTQPAVSRSAYPILTLGVGMNVVAAAGGVGPMGDASVAVGLHPVGRWSVGLLANLPVVSAAAIDRPPYGSTDAKATMLGGEVGYALGRQSWLLHPDVALGGAAVALRLDGSANLPFRASSPQVWMGAVLARGGVALVITGDWRVRADATLGVALPRESVSFAGDTVATWGQPVFAGGASIEAGLR